MCIYIYIYIYVYIYIYIYILACSCRFHRQLSSALQQYSCNLKFVRTFLLEFRCKLQFVRKLLLVFRLESTWNSLGVHLEPTWSPLGAHLELTWSLFGVQGAPGVQQKASKRVQKLKIELKPRQEHDFEGPPVLFTFGGSEPPGAHIV